MVYTEIKHFSHQHNLIQKCDETPYKCDGCKEPGWGMRYRCEECNFDLHNDCALAPPTMSHSFYGKCIFQFLEHVRGDRYCNACGQDILGFVYHCCKNGHDLHPCCANLPRSLLADGVKLHLHESLSSKCGRCCGKELWGKVRGWSYRSKSGEHHFHVSCVKKMVLENWKKGCFGGEFEMDGSAMVPCLQLCHLNGGDTSKRKVRKCWKIGKVVLYLLVSIIIGNPTGGITSLIGSLLQ